jgi:hypothetical protein
MDGAFLLLVLGSLCCGSSCSGFLLVGGAHFAPSWVMGTLGMLGSKFLHIVKVMGILVAERGYWMLLFGHFLIGLAFGRIGIGFVANCLSR